MAGQDLQRNHAPEPITSLWAICEVSRRAEDDNRTCHVLALARRRRSRAIAGSALAAIALGAAGCAASANAFPSSPYLSAVPTVLPVATKTAGTCQTPGGVLPTQEIGNTLVGVAPDPTSVTLVRLPAEFGEPCRILKVDYGSSVAKRLAGLVNQTKVPDTGASAGCGGSLGSRIELYFHDGQGSPSQFVEVDESNCPTVLAPGHTVGESSPLVAAVNALTGNS